MTKEQLEKKNDKLEHIIETMVTIMETMVSRIFKKSMFVIIAQ